MLNLDLFIWWVISISWSIVFLIVVSIYLYEGSKRRHKESTQKTTNAVRLGKDFVFVWVLLGLLIFYIVSIQIGSAAIFAAGNIVVEALLIIYLISNRKEKTEQS